ncbi:MAG TPA: hypothetical protein VEW66_04625 [Thermomicrobiales bacterium]|nr:hypothetical protein [Thermomicrobiales bacterium]
MGLLHWNMVYLQAPDLLEENFEAQAILIGSGTAINDTNQDGEQVKRVLAEKRSKDKSA